MDDGARPHAIRQLVQDHYEVVYRFAYRLSGSSVDAEDLTQQAFTIACRKLEQLREQDRARSWLFTIVRHAYVKTLHRRAAPFSALESEPEPVEKRSSLELPEHIDEELLQAALRDLPETFRTPLLLFFFDDLSYKEIAQKLEVPIGTVMSRLSRAKAFLKERLQPEPLMNDARPRSTT